MRTFILLLLTVAVFVGVYLMLAWLLPDPNLSVQRDAEAVVRVLPKPSQGVVGEIEGITLRSHDERTGAAIAEIRVGAYRRASEQEVVLQRIEAIILISDGSVVTLSAPTGRVDVESAAAEAGRVTADSLGRAESARLKDVTVRLFPDAAAAARGPGAAVLAMQVENLVYDNERLTLATADTVIDGATVLADDVRVVVRGRDYDFDGQGLLVRWDAASRRPALVRVARGERLTIKTRQPFVPTHIVRDPAGQKGVMLASAQDAAVGDALAGAVPLEPYRATLEQNLRVEQGGIIKLEGDRAEAIFAIAAPEQPAPEPETRETGQEQESPETRPAEAPFQPVTVRWEGELRLEAIESAEAQLRDEGDARVHIVGAPLAMRDENAEVRCLELRYNRGADSLELLGLEADPVTLTDVEGNTLVTTRLLAHPDAATATAAAAGYAELAAEDGRRLQLRWAQQCDFEFEKGQGTSAAGSASLKRLRAEGGVTVRHPDVSVDADGLTVELEPPQREGGRQRQQLRSVVATGNVRTLLGQEQERTTLMSRQLTLTTPQGEEGPIIAVAEGQVQSEQEGQRLTAEVLRVRLETGAEDEPRMRELEARGGVNGVDDAGRTVTADLLRVTPVAGEGEDALHVRLEGTPQRPAAVSAGEDVLSAPIIEYLTARGAYHVPGSGQLDTRQPIDGGERASRVNWSGSMTGDPASVAVEGDVVIGVREGITELSFSANRAQVDLAEPVDDDDPQAQPAEEEPGAAAIAGEVEKLTLSGELRMTAEEQVQGVLLRSFDLRADSLEAWPMGETARLVIPGAGRVLYRDQRPAEAGERERAGLEGFRGSAAFAWQQQLSYEPDPGLLTLEGGATVVVEPTAGPGGGQGAGAAGRPQQFRLDAQRLIATTAQAGDQLDFRQLIAEGRARFAAGNVTCEAGRIVYDPEAQTVTATGEAGNPVTVLDARGVPTGRFAELVYNVSTGQIDRLRDLGVAR